MLGILALLTASCEYEEVQHEVGYKGKARVNPWLAAERFCTRMGHSTQSLVNWRAPDDSDSVWFVPAEVLNNRSYIRNAEEWVENGGHLVLLVEHADSSSQDWTKYWVDPELEEPFNEFLSRSGIKLDHGPSKNTDHFVFDGRSFQVEASSEYTVAGEKKNSGLLTSKALGEGRLTVVSDARIFRSRWIGDHQHAGLLESLVTCNGVPGTVVFMRGMELSLWEMVREHLWALLIALPVLLILWLWKNLVRFGPVEASQPPSELRGYGRHLEALGDFQWRMDHASSLLAPLRAQIVELGQRASLRAGCRDQDFFQFLGDRAGIPRDRVFRAMAEAEPTDAPVLTRTTADLQQLLKVLRHPSQS